jgi:hypothetical protein
LLGCVKQEEWKEVIGTIKIRKFQNFRNSPLSTLYTTHPHHESSEESGRCREGVYRGGDM